ncbi:MAG: ATP-binding cassette domain-containing protein [Planctomycetota bacterium]|nr:MAG: ATP-binding cassette domain-containing protein [Planctomycetota bacterium]
MSSILEMRDVHKFFGAAHVLRGIDLTVPIGTIQVVLGLSGSGKTTLLKILNGSLRANKGSIRVFDEELTTLDRAGMSRYRQRMGMIFQYSALLGSLSVLENIALPLVENKGRKVEDCIEVATAALRRVFLPADILDRKPAALSGGMRKRVGIARALVQEPELLLYDEPTSGLDPVTARGVDELVLQLKRDMGITSVIISHDINAAMRIADNIAILHRGEILMSGSPKELQQCDHPAVRQLLDGEVDGPLTEAYTGNGTAHVQGIEDSL